MRQPQPTSPPVQRIVADLRRLETEAEQLMSDATILARGQKLMAVRAAYDLALLDACEAVGAPSPQRRPPFSSGERLMTTVELTRCGLRW